MILPLLFVFFAFATVQASSVDERAIFKMQNMQFQRWMTQYNKIYAPQEYATRFHNFVNTMKLVEAENRRSKELNSTATFGLTKFADMSPEEFSALLRARVSVDTARGARVASLPESAPPTSWDWRTKGGITPPKNEGQCGSCWAMTVAMAIESAYMIHKGKKDQQPLSTQQIIDCDTNDYGCNGGEPTTAYDYVVKAKGLATNAVYPYHAQDGTCRNLTANELEDPITGYVLAIPQGSKDEIALANFLATNQPISTAVDASKWYIYTGGVLLASQCGQNIDHGVQIVAYNGLDKNGYWVIRNMWGTDWGEKGFIRLQFGENTCGLTSLPTAPTLPQ